jgi:hypothetical protein
MIETVIAISEIILPFFLLWMFIAVLKHEQSLRILRDQHLKTCDIILKLNDKIKELEAANDAR